MRELFDGGLVNARDPSLLEPGELQRCDNLIYRPASPSLEQAPGHFAVTSSAGGEINGLRHCAFDNGLSLLVVQTAGAYKSTPANNPGVWSTLVTHAAGSALDSVHYDGKHYLFNGIGPNQVLLRDGTVRRHGLAPVTTSPGVSDGGAGVWPLTDDQLPAYYEYWTTEVYKNEALGEEIESTFTGEPVTFYVSASNKSVLIQRPTIVNSGIATHWRVYRSISKKLDSADVAFPLGFLIADVEIGTSTFKDGGAITTALTLAGTAFTGGAGAFFLPWTLPTNVTADDGNVATSATVTDDGAQAIVVSQLVAHQFNFTGIGTPITDITVEVEGRIVPAVGSEDAFLTAKLSWDGGQIYTDVERTFTLTTATASNSVGGTWGRTWYGTELTNSKFRVLLEAHGDPGSTLGGAIELDYVKVKVTHGGTSSEQTTIFPFTEVVVGGTSYKNGSFGEPVAASFGDIFGDSLVTNDPDNKGAIRYTLETLVEASPPEYFLPLTTDKHDEVTAIKTLGSILMVGLNTYLARVDFLPRAEDSEFSRGRAWDVVQGSHGIVGKRAAVPFFIPKIGYYLAHVSRHGVMMSNGYQADTLTDDLNFPALVNTSKLSDCEFINHPEEYRLILYYTPTGGSSNTKALVFYYHPSHLKNGKLKVSGPLDVVHTGATVALLPTGEEVLFTASGGIIYHEGSGAGTPYVLKTREIYPGGPGISGEVTKVLLHQNGGGTYKVTPTVHVANVDPRTDPVINVVGTSHGTVRVPMRIGCDGMSFQIEREEGSGGGLNYLVLEYAGFGTENYPA